MLQIIITFVHCIQICDDKTRSCSPDHYYRKYTLRLNIHITLYCSIVKTAVDDSSSQGWSIPTCGICHIMILDHTMACISLSWPYLINCTRRHASRAPSSFYTFTCQFYPINFVNEDLVACVHKDIVVVLLGLLAHCFMIEGFSSKRKWSTFTHSTTCRTTSGEMIDQPNITCGSYTETIKRLLTDKTGGMGWIVYFSIVALAYTDNWS